MPKPLRLRERKTNVETLGKILGMLRTIRNTKGRTSEKEKKLRLYPADSLSKKHPIVRARDAFYRIIIKKFAQENKLTTEQALAFRALIIQNYVGIEKRQVIIIHDRSLNLMSLQKSLGKKRLKQILIKWNSYHSKIGEAIQGSKQLLRKTAPDLVIEQKYASTATQSYLRAIDSPQQMIGAITLDTGKNNNTLICMQSDQSLSQKVKTKTAGIIMQNAMETKKLVMELYPEFF